MRYMTEEEIQAEQELMMAQRLKSVADAYVENFNGPEISYEEAEKIVSESNLENIQKVSKKKRTERFDTCKSCEKFFIPSKICLDCGCFIPIKTWGKNDSCPLNKW